MIIEWTNRFGESAMLENGLRIPDTFCDGEIEGLEISALDFHHDDRGWLLELFRSDTTSESNLPAMAYVSETLAGVARGPHVHIEQSDMFVLLGPARFELRFWDIRPESTSFGRQHFLESHPGRPLRILVPPGVVHGYRNTDVIPGLIFNAPNRLYRGEGSQGPIDEIRYEERTDHPFEM